MKIKQEYICITCYSRTKPVESELKQIIEESIEENLVYIDPIYKRILRKEERERGEKDEKNRKGKWRKLK